MDNNKLQELKKDIRICLNDIVYEEGKKNTFFHKLREKGLTNGQITGVLEGNIALDSLDKEMLGLIGIIISQDLNYKKLDINKYFSELDLERLKFYKVEQNVGEIVHPIILKGVTQVRENQWNTVVPAEWFRLLMNSNLLNYNIETQRQSKQIVTGTKDVISLATVNWKAVDEIAKELQKGTFVPNTITLNIPQGTDFGFEPRSIVNNGNRDIKAGDLILKDGRFDIIDGYHRTLAILRALDVTQIDINFEVRIVRFSVDEARQFIIQEDKRNPIDKSYIKSIDTTDNIRNVIDSLNKNPRSELRGQIVTNIDVIKQGIGLVTFDNLYNPISKYWNPKTIIEEDELADYLRDYFNHLIGHNPERFKNNKQYLIEYDDPKMITLFIKIAKFIQDDENYKELLKEITKQIENNEEYIYNKFKDYSPSDAVRLTKKFSDTMNEIMEVLI